MAEEPEIGTPVPDEPPDMALERLTLERERLALERDRLDERERRLDELEAALSPGDEHSVTLVPTAVAVLAAACIVIGALIGAALGWDAGRAKAPPPRKVLVSRRFLSMLARTGGLPLRDGAAADDSAAARAWFPAVRAEFPENAILIR